MKYLLTILLPIALFGGVIKSPSGCDLPAVAQELRDIVKKETGQNVKDVEITTQGPSLDLEASYVCQCRLLFDGGKHSTYAAYIVTPIDKAYVGLPKNTVARYKSMSDTERKKYVRVEYLKSLNDAIKDGGQINVSNLNK